MMSRERAIYYLEMALLCWLLFFTISTILAVVAAFARVDVAGWLMALFSMNIS